MSFPDLSSTSYDTINSHIERFSNAFNPNVGSIYRGGNESSFGNSLNSRFPVTENPDYTNEPVVYPLMMSPLKNDRQLMYTEGDILFSYSKKSERDAHKLPTYSIWNLNFETESLARRQQEIDEGQDIEINNKKRKNADNDITSKIPINLDSHIENWVLSGIIVSDRTINQSRGPQDIGDVRGQTIAVACAGRVTIPNYWGYVKVGEYVGLNITMVNGGYYDKFFDINGSVLDEPTTCPFLQIVPVRCQGGRIPPMFLDLDDIKPERDLVYKQETVVKQMVYGYLSPLQETKTLVYEQTRQSRYIELGIVLKTPSFPSDYQIKMGLRSEPGFKSLMNKAPLVINMSANGEVPSW